MHRLTEPELDNLASGFNSIHMNFFTLSVGMLAGFAITLLTVGAELSDRMFAVFIALAAVAVIGTIYFGIKAFAERRALDKLIKRIKEGRT